ncbi:MAG TPA: ATP-binding protein [Polyangia bacterium]|jgi:PAS domain S-box-containing protein|nr:ATP-binding protein [Polyangia bacterium]
MPEPPHDDEAEAALRASEAYTSSVITSALDGIVTFDDEARIMAFNPAAERMYGYRAADILGKSLLEMLVPPSGRKRQAANLARWVETKQIGVLLPRQELAGLRADGSRFPIELTLVRPSERPSIYVAFMRDLTDIKRIDAERRRLEEQLRNTQKMDAVGRLAGGVAHDFNNLLSVILGFTDLSLSALAAEGAPRDPQRDVLRDNLGEVRNAAERAVALVRQLLAFSRRQVLSPRVLDPRALVLNLERILAGLAGEQIELYLNLDDKTGRIKADAGQIEQVVLNLAMNARDAMPDGGRLRIATANVELPLSPTEGSPKRGRYVRLTVEDNGTGMSEDVQAHVFEPFFTTKGTGKGPGLGLSTVYGIVRQSGGHVRFESALGQGTRFEVDLPRIDDDAAVPEAVNPMHTPVPSGETILLVEDDEAVRHLVRRILEQSGYRVILARHGGEALEFCRRLETHIDLMLTDAVMPVLSGPELLRRAIALRPNMKLALMSGYSDRPAVTGIPFIAKPFTPSELERRIRELLDGPHDVPSGTGRD